MKQTLPILVVVLFATASIAKPQIPAATNLEAASISPTQINLNWVDNATNEVGYQIWMSRDGSSYNEVGNVGVGGIRYSAVGLLPATQYWFKVRAYAKGGGQSPYSNVATTTTLSQTTPTPTPVPTPTPTPTPVPTPTPTPVPTPTPPPVPTPTPVPTPIPAQLVTVTVVWTATKGDGYTILYGKEPTPDTQADGGVAIQDGTMVLSLGNLEANTLYYFSDIVTSNGAVSSPLPPITYTTTTAHGQSVNLPQ
jgi:Fibronectin type III domain